MEQSQTVTVHYFLNRGYNAELLRPMGCKATAATIADMDAEIIPGTEEDVPSAQVDDQGFYRRIATGWGVLA